MSFDFRGAPSIPRRYNISIDVQYKTPEGKELVDGAATSVMISPRPYVLSSVAVVASVLGTLLSLVKSNVSEPSDSDYIVRFLETWYSGTFIGSAVLALVIFNVYEHIGLRDRFKAPVSWRSALLIGILCGLFQDRLLAALGALLPS